MNLEQVLQLSLLNIISEIDMQSKIKILICIQLFFFIISCATSQQGTEQVVTFTSIPSGATVKTSHGFSCSITPCKIRLPRNKSFEAIISKPGFTTDMLSISLSSFLIFSDR